MKNIDSKELESMQGVGRSFLVIHRPIRTDPKLPIIMPTLPKPGPVVG